MQLIKNLDTGEKIDIRKPEQLSILENSKKGIIQLKKQDNAWKDY